MKISTTWYETVAKLEYFTIKLAEKNVMHERIKKRSNSRRASYYLVQNISTFSLLRPCIKIKECRNIIQGGSNIKLTYSIKQSPY